MARAELTERTLIAGQRHLLTILEDYAAHYSQHRPHRALNLRQTAPRWHRPGPPISRPRKYDKVPGGLIN
jgi:hypothetical protein